MKKMMKEKILETGNKFVASLLIAVQLALAVPVFALGSAADALFGAREQSLPHLERYLDMAALERGQKAWQELADEGLAAAMREWENAALALFQTEQSQDEREAIENERKNTAGSFKLVIAERYAKWLSERSYENAENSANSKARLAAELKEKAASWHYTNSAGVSTRQIQHEDTKNAAAAWRAEIADEIILKYLDEWEAQNFGENYRNRITAEYRRIAKMQENALLHSLLYDTKSLKKEKEDEAAKAIAELLAKEAKEITDADSKKLFDSLSDKIESADAKQQITQSELDSWLEEFRITFQKGLSQWENAEREFLASRARWEAEAAEVYVNSEQTWADAYSKLRAERSAWEHSIQQQLDEGKKQWALESEALSRMLEKASADFESAALKERNNFEQNIDLQIALYTQSREMLQSAFEGLNYWYDRWAAKFDKVYTNPATAPPPFLQFEKDKKVKATPQNTDTAQVLDEISDWKNKYCKFIQDEYTDYAVQKNKELDAEAASLKKQIDRLQKERNYVVNAAKTQSINREIVQLQKKLSTDIPAKRQNLVQGANQLSALSGNMSAAEIAKIMEAVKAQSGFCENRIQDERDPLERVWNAPEEAASWLVMIEKYTKSAENALQELFSLSGNIFSSAATWEYLDELDVELIKAKAVARYWATEEDIALAVDRYAQNVTSGIDASEETRKNVDAAKKAYEATLAQYQAEIAALDALYAQIDGKNGKIQVSRNALEYAKTKAEEAREKYALTVIAEKQIDDTPLRKKIYEAIVKMNTFYKEAGNVEDLAVAHNIAALKLAQGEYEKSCNDALFAIVNGNGGAEKSLTALQNLATQAHEKQLSAIPAEYANLRVMLDEISSLPATLQGAYADKIWSIIEQYWQSKVDERENALRYITAGENVYENRYAQSTEIKIENKTEVEIWLTLQKELAGDFGDAAFVALCETFLDAMKNGGIDAIKNAAALLCATEDAATNVLVKKLLGQNTIFAGTNFAGLDLYLFENECEKAHLRDAEKSANLTAKYSYCVASFLNTENAKSQDAVSRLFSEREAAVMDGDTFDSGEFLRYIRELQTAGSGLNSAQQISLDAYISALYEKAAIKIAVQKAAGTDAANNDINKLYAELEVLQSWQNRLAGADGVAALVTACSSANFGLDENFVVQLAQTASLILMQKLSVEELENCTDTRSVLALIEHTEFKDASLEIKEKIASHVLKYFGQDDFSVLCDAAKPYAQSFTDYLYACENASSDMFFASPEFLANPLYAIFLSMQNPVVPSARYAQLETEPDLGADALYLYLMTIAHNNNVSAQADFASCLVELEKLSPEKAALVKSFYEKQALSDAYLKLIHGDIGAYTDDEDVRFALRYGTKLVKNAVNKREFARMLKPALNTDDSDILLRMRDDSLKTLRELLSAMTSAKYEEVKIAQNVMRLNSAIAAEKAQSSVDWLEKAKEFAISDFGSEFDKNTNTLESALSLIHKKSALHKNALQAESLLDATKISAENIRVTEKTGSSAEEKEFSEAYTNLQNYFNEQKSAVATIYRYIGSITELRELQKSGELSAKVVAAKAVFDAAETEVAAARDAYSDAVDELNVMCNDYNTQLEKTNTAFDAAKEAQILKQKQQALFDWASSIYLEGFGKNASSKYLSPKEKLTQAQFAKVRADAAVNVLENMTAQKIDAQYEGALSGYEKAYENYYTARAIAYETVREIARKEQEVRDAEYDYHAALLKLISENKLEQDETKVTAYLKTARKKHKLLLICSM